jgi:hypothetical protein
METPFLDFYNESIKKGNGKMYSSRYSPENDHIPSGLCDFYEKNWVTEAEREFFMMVKPTEIDRDNLVKEGVSTYTWGSGVPSTEERKYVFHEFTPLRQNIVLLMAAMNNEL